MEEVGFWPMKGNKIFKKTWGSAQDICQQRIQKLGSQESNVMFTISPLF